jgi:hypothetical protein
VVGGIRVAPVLVAAPARARLGLCTTQIDAAAEHVRLLHVEDEVLRHALLLERDEAEAATGVGARVLHNLDVLDETVLAEEARELLLSQMVVESAHKHFIARPTGALPARAALGKLRVVLRGGARRASVR